MLDMGLTVNVNMLCIGFHRRMILAMSYNSSSYGTCYVKNIIARLFTTFNSEPVLYFANVALVDTDFFILKTGQLLKPFIIEVLSIYPINANGMGKYVLIGRVKLLNASL